MISALIFSKDRACQLDLLLRSLERNDRGIFSYTVLYTASTPQFELGYHLLKSRSNPAIRFWRETNFRDDHIAIFEENWADFVCCFTDDGILYRRLPASEKDILSQLTDDVACFSLRIGKNTMLETYWEGRPTPPLLCSEFADFIKWNHKQYPGHFHFGYPLSQDGHIFRREQFLDYLKRLPDFFQPNSLEGALCRFKDELQPNMVAFKESCLVVCPVNRVQNVCENMAGYFYSASAEELNERYLAGEVIDLDQLDFSSVVGTHQEFRYRFKKV